jgi:hypothetical protein
MSHTLQLAAQKSHLQVRSSNHSRLARSSCPSGLAGRVSPVLPTAGLNRGTLEITSGVEAPGNLQVGTEKGKFDHCSEVLVLSSIRCRS